MSFLGFFGKRDDDDCELISTAHTHTHYENWPITLFCIIILARLEDFRTGWIGRGHPLHWLSLLLSITWLLIGPCVVIALSMSDYSSILSFIDGILDSAKVPKGNKKRINFNISSSGLL